MDIWKQELQGDRFVYIIKITKYASNNQVGKIGIAMVYCINMAITLIHQTFKFKGNDKYKLDWVKKCCYYPESRRDSDGNFYREDPAIEKIRIKIKEQDDNFNIIIGNKIYDQNWKHNYWDDGWIHFQRECPEMRINPPYMNLPHSADTTIIIKNNDILGIGITPSPWLSGIRKNDKYIIYNKSTNNNHIHTLYEGFNFIES